MGIVLWLYCCRGCIIIPSIAYCTTVAVLCRIRNNSPPDSKHAVLQWERKTKPAPAPLSGSHHAALHPHQQIPTADNCLQTLSNMLLCANDSLMTLIMLRLQTKTVGRVMFVHCNGPWPPAGILKRGSAFPPAEKTGSVKERTCV